MAASPSLLSLLTPPVAPAPAGLTPRPYQEHAITTSIAKWGEGVRRQLIVAATGLGKTVVFVDLARRLGLRTMILAHRDELINQAVDKVHTIWPDVQTGVVKAERNELDMPVVVASVQTLSREARLAQVAPTFGLVIVDEAHHAVADTYRRVLTHLGCFADDGPLLVGVTATPDRGDAAGLAPVFDEIVCTYDMRWGIKHGYLSDLRAIHVWVDADLDSVRTTRGDYSDGDLGRVLQAADAPEHILDAWKTHASDRRTLAFTPTVAMAEELADVFGAAGVRAAHVSGVTRLDDRRDVLDRFASGDLQVLANCGVLTEGYDGPFIDCIIMGRPTKSRGFYQQMVGRGTRRFPLKSDCLILDVVGAARRHSLVSAASLLGLDDVTRSARGAIVDQEREERERQDPAEALGTLVTEEVDLWAQVEETEFHWVRTVHGFTLALGGDSVSLQQLGGGYGAIIRRAGERTILSSTKRRDESTGAVAGVDLELAQGLAEDWARTRLAASETPRAWVQKDARWRSQKASPPQIDLLESFGIPVTEGLTKGEASDLITAAKAAKRR